MLVQWTDLSITNEDWPLKLEGIRAIECREFHLRCWECRFSRWFGQSREDAQLAASKHQLSKGHTQQSVDYLRHPYTYKEFRIRYGGQRKVKPFITSNWQYKAVNGGIAGRTVQLPVVQSVLSEDKPPF